MTSTLPVTVDDRRALWALTERHLRSPSFPAVLLVRHALRRGATSIRVTQTRAMVRVVDNGAPLDADIDAVDAVLAAPTVARMHDLERDHGIEVLTATATARAAVVVGRRWRLETAQGTVTRRVPDRSEENVVELHRDGHLRAQEHQELRSWLPSPRARVTVNGRALGAPPELPDAIALPRSMSTPDGKGVIGFALDDAVSRVTYLARGVWVAHEQHRPRGLPVRAIWDHNVLAPHPDEILVEARRRVAAATEQLIAQLGEQFTGLTAPTRRALRTRLLRSDVVPPALVDVPLFDSDDGAFCVSLRALMARERIVVGSASGDVVGDDDARAFLRRRFGDRVKDALPPPRRRALAVVRAVKDAIQNLGAPPRG